MAFVFGALGLCASPRAQDVSLEMTISASQVTLDEIVELVITVKGVQKNLPTPNITGLDDFTISSQGQSQNVSIVNGVVEKSVMLTFELTPKKAGTFRIGPSQMTIGSAVYHSNVVTLTVGAAPPPAASSQAKDLFLEAVIDKKNPYVGEQVTLRVRFFRAVNLLSQPEYTPPKTTDFWSETIEAQRNYYENLSGRRYLVTEITTALFPTRPGEVEIGQTALEVMAQTSTQQRKKRDPFSDPFFNFGGLSRGETVRLRSRPIQLTVRALPTEKKPSDFSGAVGQYSFEATCDKRTVEVNSPVSVSLVIEGRGNVKTLPSPALPELPDFRVYAGSTSEKMSTQDGRIGGHKIFEQVFIPRREGQLEIPSSRFVYFDPAKSQYITVATKPISITASGSGQGSFAESPFTPPSGAAIGSDMRTIRYIKKNPGRLRPTAYVILLDPLFIALNVFPALAILGAVVIRRRRDRLGSDLAYARARGAARQAKKRLSTAAKVAHTSTADQFFGEIRLAVFSYVADKRNISQHGMTLDDVCLALAQAGFTESEIEACRALVSKAEYARYAAGVIAQTEIDQALRDAEALLVHIMEANIV